MKASTHRERKSTPRKLFGAIEMLRADWESLTLKLSNCTLTKTLPTGDGHTVFLIPGFMGGDSSLFTLRDLLRDLNYDARTWGQGVNFGGREELMEAFVATVQSAAEENGGRRMSFIGQSLGGIYAREVAREAPALIRQVISLGSPFMSTGTEQSSVSDIYEYMNPEAMAEYDARQANNEELPSDHLEGIHSTSIYSRTDGVVHWSTCIQQASHMSENIEVKGSHSGMGTNPLVIEVIADRLAQSEGEWQLYQPKAGLQHLIRTYED